MTTVQALAVFGGGPALIVLLIFLPFYGRRWARWLVRPVRRRPAPSTDAPPDAATSQDSRTSSE